MSNIIKEFKFILTSYIITKISNLKRKNDLNSHGRSYLVKKLNSVFNLDGIWILSLIYVRFIAIVHGLSFTVGCLS